MTVHYLKFGMTPHPVVGDSVRTTPKDWPEGHVWSQHWTDVNCKACLEAHKAENANTYVMAPDNSSITCLRCKRSSTDPEHVDKHWCPFCQASHDDIWPPARKWWIDNPDLPPPRV